MEIVFTDKEEELTLKHIYKMMVLNEYFYFESYFNTEVQNGLYNYLRKAFNFEFKGITID